MPTRLEVQQTKWNANTSLLQARKRAAHIELDEMLAHEVAALLEEGEHDYIVGMYASALEYALEVHEIIDCLEEG